MNERVEIPAYTDRWMMGDRYGDLLEIVPPRKRRNEDRELACVRLDKSGKVRLFILADCRFV